MTSSATQPASGTGGHRAEGQGYGLVLFASVLLVIIGCFNLIYGIAAVARPDPGQHRLGRRPHGPAVGRRDGLADRSSAELPRGGG
jgi:hypothetical protein